LLTKLGIGPVKLSPRASQSWSGASEVGDPFRPSHIMRDFGVHASVDQSGMFKSPTAESESDVSRLWFMGK